MKKSRFSEEQIIGFLKQAEDQYVCTVKPFCTPVMRWMARSPAGQR